MKWFTKAWWEFLFAPKSKYYWWPEVLLCRARGHPDGVIWYTMNEAFEPDMTCKGCGDDLS
ncbi:hypothetical protein E4H12_06510 [Candidatus Thorarchaeota archaeon]|nr:MAG: hypothetical protein E4H12_06510 [Candidatus Thorarchaeota archaeon]